MKNVRNINCLNYYTYFVDIPLDVGGLTHYENTGGWVATTIYIFRSCGAVKLRCRRSHSTYMVCLPCKQSACCPCYLREIYASITGSFMKCTPYVYHYGVRSYELYDVYVCVVCVRYDNNRTSSESIMCTRRPSCNARYIRIMCL